MIKNEELVKYCQQELSDANSGDLADQREKALDYYHGDVSEYLPAQEDRSEVSTRDVFDTIESVLPSLIKIFIEEENAIEFVATSPQDEAQAKLETQAVRSVFFRENEGFMNLYTFIKDALTSKVGILETFTEDEEFKREEYTGLDEIELQRLSLDPYVEFESAEENGETYDVVLKVRCPPRVGVDTVTPEEFGVASDTASPSVKKAQFCWKTTKKSASELIEMGFDRKVIEECARAGEEQALGSEALARRRLSDEQETSHAHWSMAKLWITQCYPKIDRNDDGIAETLKVTLVGPGEAQYTNLKLLKVEEVRTNPFATATPIIQTHKFYGNSLADLIMEIQEIRTALFRGILDNMYLANNVRVGANDNVELDDLLTSRPGGVVRTRGTASPSNDIYPIVHPPVPNQSFGLLEVLDDMVKNRTGVGDEVAGLDSQSLSNINTGVIMQAYEQARMRIELMARIIAEVGLKDCFQDIREELHTIQDQSIQLKIGANWVDLNPRAWADKRRVKINIGLGNATKVQRKVALEKTLMLQEKAQMTGYMTPMHLHNSATDLMELEGMDVNRYFPNPQTFQPPQKQPDPQVMLDGERLKLERMRIETDKEKMMIDAQLRQSQNDIRAAEAANRKEIEHIKANIGLQRQIVDEQSQLMRAQAELNSANLNNDLKVREQVFDEQKSAAEISLENQKLLLEEFQAKLKAITEIEKKQMELEQRVQQSVMQHVTTINQAMMQIEAKRSDEKNKILDYLSVNGSDRGKNLAKQLRNQNEQ